VIDLENLTSAVASDALTALAREHHGRTVVPFGTRVAGAHLVKVYGLQAPGRAVTEDQLTAALLMAASYLGLGAARGSVGMAVLIVHAGGDGDYVVVHTWIEGYMSDLAIFSGPAGLPDLLRPARAGLAPCVWEAAVIAHERDAFSRHMLGGSGALQDRLTAWAADTLQGEVR
jgi:hypothetical protein